MTKRCIGRNKSLRRCSRTGSWSLFCEDHKNQWLIGIVFIIFTIGGGAASIYDAFPRFNLGIQTIDIKGSDGIERILNQAELEGVYLKKSSAEYVVSKVVTRSDVSPKIVDFPNYFMFVSVSPFKPTKMENVFEAGDCRFIGVGKILGNKSSKANIDIKTISCIDNSRNSFSLDADKHEWSRVGYIADINDISNEGILVGEEDRMLTLPAGKNVLVKFDKPITTLKIGGKSYKKW